ncbi:MAG: phosphoribosylformylglycinamidine synthase subunit PurS [Bifidobacteriaceae bacterium]|jgi:phosphoribosylformylglycinamidine synthase|nr:phosphoribosylformylglycinamidine synthase subunit PurS [Bifidobacteriaceae bacterium]
MPRVIVDVCPKPEILDPQGKAVKAALIRLGYTGIDDVRQGKRFELTVDHEPTPADLTAITEAASSLLSNPVIEDVVSIRVESSAPPAGPSQ